MLCLTTQLPRDWDLEEEGHRLRAQALLGYLSCCQALFSLTIERRESRLALAARGPIFSPLQFIHVYGVTSVGVSLRVSVPIFTPPPQTTSR